MSIIMRSTVEYSAQILVLICFLAALESADGGSITWYEPLPVKTVSIAGDDTTPAEMKLYEGYPASLSWNFSLTSLTLFAATIKFDADTLATSGAGGSAAQVMNDYRDKFNFTWISKRLTLVIFNVTAAYDKSKGKFICEFTTSEGGWKRNIQVEIVAPPSITPSRGYQTVNEGSDLALFCNATGKPTPNITWTRVLEDGTSIKLPFVGSSWRTENIRRNFTGRYRCTANNGIGSSVNDTISVNVLFKPGNVTLERNTTENNGCTDMWVNFTCKSSEANPPVYNYVLLKNETDAGLSEKGTWTEKISRGETFVFKCQAYQQVNNVTSTNNISLSVKVPAALEQIQNITVEEGRNVLKGCNVAAGTPPLNVFWKNVKTGHVTEGKLLTIINIRRNQGGEYRCIVNNTCGYESTGMFIDVQFKPDNVSLERNTTENNGCTDMWVNFTCKSSEANPPVHNYVLLRNKKGVGFSEKGTWIEKISRGETFVYKCQAYQQVSNVTSTNNISLSVKAALEQIQNVTVKEGGNVTKECSVTAGTPPLNVSWKNVKTGQVTKGKLLTIFNIRRNQSGEYRCTANNTCGSDSLMMFIDVQYSPSITHIMNDMTFNENDRVTLDCQADGNPPPTIRWIFVNDSSYVPGLFYITGKQNEGFYRCIAENSVGRDESTRNVYLTVFFSPRITTVSNDQTVIEGSSLILFCNTAGKPAPNITWARVLDDGTDSEVLFVGNPWIIVNVKKNFIGTYRCEANNGIGIPVNRTVFVSVLFKPNDVTLETNTTENNDCVDLWVNFTCNTSTANPPAHYYLLLKNESEVSFSVTGTWIEKISQGTTFVYSCTAYQQVENVTSRNNVTVTVNVPPAMEQVQNATVKEGRDVTKECNVTTGTPPLTIFWENVKSGQITTGKLLNITNITRYQTEYRCVANNTCGSVLTTMFIDVQYKPSSSQSSSTIKLELGEDRSIGCPVDIGNPPAVITWYSGNDTTNKKITTSSTLDVQNAAFRDEGWYTCYANNELGNTTVSLLLLVVQTVSSTVAASSQTTPAASGGTEVYLTATIQENCSRRSEVAAKFPEMACQIAFRFGCSSANTVNTRCGSVVLDFMMRFNQSVFVNNVLTVLWDAARQDKFGGFKVNPDSIKQVFIPTDGSESTTKGPEECNCPSNNVLLAIIGVLAFTILLLIIYIIWLHRKGAVGKERTYKDERGVYDNELELEDFEPSQPDSRNLRQPFTEYMDLIVSKDNRKAQSADLGADYAPLHPSTRSWEVARSHVTIEKIIGKGAFGQVAKGTAVGLRERPETTTVAIKMLKTNAAESDKRDLMKELDTMKQLKPHPYVIKLLGCVSESEPLLVLIEYVPFGDLLGYLRKSRGLKDTYFKDPDIKPQTNLTSQQLMRFAWQIADGMSYLSSKSIIHRDLAARNVLVGQKETCKVTDFGMARDVQQENIYERKTKGRLPVKWTAYEALLYGKYTTKSDVWSYGVLLYEIFTIGGSPYPRMDGRKIANLLQNGYRMPKPQHVDEKLYQIMMKCWKNDPDARPTFTELENQLKDMETLHKKLINMTMYDKQLYANVEDLIV